MPRKTRKPVGRTEPGRSASSKRATSDQTGWLDSPDWAFGDDDPELNRFHEALATTTLGAYSPDTPPTVFNPLITLNQVPEATLYHEQMHEELTQGTAFGKFFEFLCKLAKSGQHVAEAKMCFDQQWQVQEACATYAGLSIIAHKRPEYLSEAVGRLPSSAHHQAPYKEVFTLVAQHLPIASGDVLLRLQAHVELVRVVGLCSLSNDCLVRFTDPGELTPEGVAAYLETQSPNRRFKEILKKLTNRPLLGGLVREAGKIVRAARGRSRRPLMKRLARLIPHQKTVLSFEDLSLQHGAFLERWKPAFEEKTGTSLIFGVKGSRDPGYVVGRGGTPHQVTPMTAENLREAFVRAREEKEGVWTVIYMEDTTRIGLDLLLYPLGEGVNPSSDRDAARSYYSRGFQSGFFPAQTVLELMESFPELPHAIGFMMWSWRFWDQIAPKTLSYRSKVQVCLDLDLHLDSLKNMLAFRDLGSSARYFIQKWDDRQAVAYLAEPRRAGIYGLQYIPGDAGYIVFLEAARLLGIRELKNPESSVPHIPLLKLMAFPAFLGIRR